MENYIKLSTTILENLYDGIMVINQSREIIFWNHGAEQITGYSSSEVNTSPCYNELLQPIDENGIDLCANDCPALKIFKDGVIRTEEIYFHHKNGYRIPVKIKLTPILDNDKEVIKVIIIFSDNSEKIAIIEKLDRLKKESLIDNLTGIGNKKFIKQRLQEKIEKLKRYGEQFGVLFIDLDDFKTINDTYGHSMGDKILKMTAQTLRKSLRSFDTVGRWGGDEFVVITSNIRNKNLKKIATRLHSLINNSYLKKEEEKITITCSIGGCISNSEITVKDIIKQADNQMYTSKKTGKNKVTIG